MKPITLFNAVGILCVTLSGSCFASEWEDIGTCSNEMYSLSFEVDIESNEVYQFSFSVNKEQQNSEKWEIENGRVDRRNQTIEFEARALENGLQNIYLTVKGKNGKLRVGESDTEVKCAWIVY